MTLACTACSFALVFAQLPLDSQWDLPCPLYKMQPTQSHTHLPSFPVIFLHSTSLLLMHYIIYYLGCVVVFFHIFCSPTTSSPSQCELYTDRNICFVHWCVLAAGTERPQSRCWINTLKGRTVFNSSGTGSHPLKNRIADFFPKGDFLPFGRPRFQTSKEGLFLQMCQLH